MCVYMKIYMNVNIYIYISTLHAYQIGVGGQRMGGEAARVVLLDTHTPYSHSLSLYVYVCISIYIYIHI